MSVSGGGDRSSFYFSMNYFDQEGTLKNTYLKRYTIRANSSYDISDHLRIGENMTYSLIDNPQVGNSEGSAIGMARRMQSIIPVHDIEGNYAGASNGLMGVANNPIATQDRSKANKGKDYRLSGGVFAELDLLDRVQFRTTFGGSIFNGHHSFFTYPAYENSENSTTNQYSETVDNNYEWTWNNTITYEDSFHDIHNLKLLIGTEANKSRVSNLSANTRDYISFNLDYVNLGNGTGDKNHNSSRSEISLSSYFGRIEYGFRDKYLLNFTIRRDGSSRFIEKKHGWFPSSSIAWRLSEENFMEATRISDLKLRASYGVMGNQANVDPSNGFNAYSTDLSYATYDMTGSSSSLQSGILRSRIGSPGSTWEKNINSNIGLDATLLDGKIDLMVDYYSKRVKDLLYSPELYGTEGVSAAPTVNVAEMVNKGIDFSIATNLNLSKDLTLNANLNLTSYNNKIKKISNSSQHFDQDSRRFSGSSIVRNSVGHPVGAFFGYKVIGFWDSHDEIDDANKLAQRETNNNSAIYQADAKPGRFRYEDINGDGKIDAEDRTYIGDPNPDFTYGINLDLRYKNWSLGMFFYGSQGNDIWNNQYWWLDFYSNFNGAKSKTALYDSWTPNNRDAKAPIQERESTFSSGSVPNSYYVRDGSYLRLKNLELGYSFQRRTIERMGISNLRLYFQITNLFTITNYDGLDPEVAGGTTNFGIDEGAYPNDKSIILGVNFGI